VVVAVPVAPPSTVSELAQIADAVVSVATPSPFAAIGQWYRDFSPTTDDDVVRILDEFGGNAVSR
jgi:predicted phosphoribosyltransferase